MIFGGTSPTSIERAVRRGIGWTAGGAQPPAVGEFAARVREAWTAAGREGTPRIVALAYFGLGDDVEAGRASLRDYYGWLGDWVEGSPGLVFDGAIPDAAQVDLLADIVLG